jgi:uncharacterized membrane protein
MFIFTALAAVVTTVIAGSVLVYRKGKEAIDDVRANEAPLPEKKR